MREVLGTHHLILVLNENLDPLDRCGYGFRNSLEWKVSRGQKEGGLRYSIESCMHCRVPVK